MRIISKKIGVFYLSYCDIFVNIFQCFIKKQLKLIIF